jgi:hypothetical protein
VSTPFGIPIGEEAPRRDEMQPGSPQFFIRARSRAMLPG